MLPAGHDAQPVCGFRDPTGRFSYQLNHVYGPAGTRDGRGPIRALLEDLCFWGVTWSVPGAAGDERVAGRWLTYARAREVPGARLSFARFSSVDSMRGRLDALLQLGDLSPG